MLVRNIKRNRNVDFIIFPTAELLEQLSFQLVGVSYTAQELFLEFREVFVMALRARSSDEVL